MPSKLEIKRLRVRNEFSLLKERFHLMNVRFEVEHPTGSMISTEKNCDFLLEMFRSTNQALDKISLKKDKKKI